LSAQDRPRVVERKLSCHKPWVLEFSPTRCAVANHLLEERNGLCAQGEEKSPEE
jgi:hypothetical protein